MADANSNSTKRRAKGIVFRALKATVKGVLFYIVYFILWQFMAPVSQFIPSFQQMVETFVAVYITLIIVTELTSGTIYQHFFNAAKALFVIGYLMFSMRTGIFGMTFQNMSFLIDLRLFLIVAMLLSLLGLAKSVLQAIDFMSEKAEPIRM